MLKRTAGKGKNESISGLNLATFSIEALQEHTDQPVVILQDLLQIFLDYDNYSDFQKKEGNWGEFFELVAAKMD